MRGFIVLCLSAVALAAPQGYNYNPAAGGVAVQQSGSAFGSQFGGATTGSGAGFFQGAQQQQQQGGFFQGGQVAAPALSHHHQQQQQQQHQQQAQQAIVSKRFYIHSAPEENEEDFKEKHITVGVPKKNYNVVFIKAPAKSGKKTAIKISPAVNEDKTVIYVLSKKTDSSDVHAEVVEHAAPTTKPEVFFIKYKTNEEAAHAQQQIQSQYDALGGSTQVTDEGVAPVTSVIGSLGGGDAGAIGGGDINGPVAGGNGGFNGGAGPAVGGPGQGHGNNAYLPPNFV